MSERDRRRVILFCEILALLSATPRIYGQGVLGRNLIVNGDAEAGSAGKSTSDVVSSIPGWAVASGKPNVLSYNLDGLLQLTNPAPPDHGFQYFTGNSGFDVSNLTQEIDVSSGIDAVNAGIIKYTLSGYLGSAKGRGIASPAKVTADFKNAKGQIFSSGVIGPLGISDDGMSLQQQVGIVPAGTVRVTITLALYSHCFNSAACSYGSADSLVFSLNALGTSPSAELGRNLISNPGAESGPGAKAGTPALYIPGWSSANDSSVAPYGAGGWVSPTDPGPVDRGVNVFCGGLADANIYQDLDISPATASIDSGQVQFQFSAWLGALPFTLPPTVTYAFFDWSGRQLAADAQLVAPPLNSVELALTAQSGKVPAGTRRVHISAAFPSINSFADNFSFVLISPSGPPVISAGGVSGAAAYGGSNTLSKGLWIEIYGENLSSTIATWGAADFINGTGPTSLVNVSVTAGGKPAFVDYVSPSQVNALLSSDVPAGAVPITLTNEKGISDSFWVLVNPTQPGLLAPPSLLVGGKQYVAAFLPDGKSFALPTSAVPGLVSRPAKTGETVVLYGIGFGSVDSGTKAGSLAVQADSLSTPLQVLFNNTPASLAYAGLAPGFTGLYQINVVIPNVGANSAVPITMLLGGMKVSQSPLYIATQN